MAVDTTLLGAANVFDAAAFASRARAVLPDGWFADRGADLTTPTPVLDAVLTGQGAAWALIFAQLQALFAQTRLATATGGALDMISTDFFGNGLPRAGAEPDAAFRARIGAALLPARATRAAVLAALAALSPMSWQVLEPNCVADTGVLSNAEGVGATGGYGLPGMRYGSRSFAFGALIDGIADNAAGLRTARDTPATLIGPSGSMQIAAPFVVRQQAGTTLSEARSWNLIADSLGWSEVDLGAGQQGRLACQIGTDPRALLPGQPALICMPADGNLIGPVIDIAAGSQAAAASAWVWIPTDAACQSVALQCIDGGQTFGAAANMATRGSWQRLSVSLGAAAAPRTVAMQLQVQASGPTATTLLSQCWQFEPGQVVTSYIPTAGTPAWRDADVITSVAAPVQSSLTAPAIASTVAATIPIATQCGVRIRQS